MISLCKQRQMLKYISEQLTVWRHASSSPVRGETIMNVFDRKAKRMQRDRTALMTDYKVYEYVKEEVSDKFSCVIKSMSLKGKLLLMSNFSFSTVF